MTTITIDRAVVEQALEALNNTVLFADEDCGEPDCHECEANRSTWKVIDALGEALNAPQPTAMQDWEAIAADQAMTIVTQAATIESLKEQRLMQMAAITTAALGYWKEDDSILPDYDTTALRDVAKLYAKYEALYAPQPQPMSVDQISMIFNRVYPAQPLSQNIINLVQEVEKHHGIR